MVSACAWKHKHMEWHLPAYNAPLCIPIKADSSRQWTPLPLSFKIKRVKKKKKSMLLSCGSASTHTIAGWWVPCRKAASLEEGLVRIYAGNQYIVSNSTNNNVTKLHIKNNFHCSILVYGSDKDQVLIFIRQLLRRNEERKRWTTKAEHRNHRFFSAMFRFTAPQTAEGFDLAGFMVILRLRDLLVRRCRTAPSLKKMKMRKVITSWVKRDKRWSNEEVGTQGLAHLTSCPFKMEQPKSKLDAEVKSTSAMRSKCKWKRNGLYSVFFRQQGGSSDVLFRSYCVSVSNNIWCEKVLII